MTKRSTETFDVRTSIKYRVARSLGKRFPRTIFHSRRLLNGARGLPIYLNKNKKRAEIVRQLLNEIDFKNIVETGTFLGYSTHFFCGIAERRGIKVFSAEISDDYWRLSRALLARRKNLRLYHSDSVSMLRSIRPALGNELTFFYLDAHWRDYLPLRDELASIDLRHGLAMIDDFRVPGDDLFGYDTYKDVAIAIELIADLTDDMSVFFPAYPAAEEGYRPRGYCLLTQSEDLRRRLQLYPSLRPFSVSGGASSAAGP